jgi:hypothetical protein
MLVRSVIGLLIFSTLALAPSVASAQVKVPGAHPHYKFEAEPHLAVDPFSENVGFGPGFRGTFVLMDNGFIKTINNSIGLGVGIDWMLFEGSARDAIVPVTLQWNFWLHEKWSVFGEPGVAFHIRHNQGDNFAFNPFTFYAGGRFHFSDTIALTMRFSAPTWHPSTLSVGVSFLL